MCPVGPGMCNESTSMSSILTTESGVGSVIGPILQVGNWSSE